MDTLILWLMLVTLMSSSTFSLLAPFYPEMAETEKNLSSGLVGIILSSYSLTYVTTSYLIGKYLARMGRRFTLLTGIIIQSIWMIGFGSLVWVPNKELFIIFSFTFRMLWGIASAFIWVSCYAMTSIKYPEQLQQKISLIEAANGAGLFIGPLVGGLIYQFTFFWTPFFIFTALSLLILPCMKSSFTSDLDRIDERDSSQTEIGYLKLLRNKRVFFAAMGQFFNLIIFTVGQPVFGPRLTHDYGLSSVWVGACFALPTFFYILTGPIFLPLIFKAFEKRAIMMVGFFLLAASAFLVGPSKILGMPSESAPIMIIGLCIIGTGAAFTVIPVIPEMLDSTKDKYIGQQSEVSDKFSAIFNIAGGIGQIVGPTSSGLLNDSVGFNLTFDIIGISLLSFNIIYIVFCGGFGSLGRSFRASLLRWKTKRTIKVDSAKHHLLNEEESADDVSSDSSSPRMNKDGKYEDPESANVSTDISFNGESPLTIN